MEDPGLSKTLPSNPLPMGVSRWHPRTACAASSTYRRKTKRVLNEMGQEWVSVGRVEEAKQHFPELTGRLATPGFDQVLQ